MRLSSSQGSDASVGKTWWWSGTFKNLTLDRLLSAILAVACIGLLVYKMALTRRLNINWDEFNFLSLIYIQARGELTQALASGFTHFFGWLLLLSGDEIQLIVTARWVMVVLLAVTAWLVWRLARLWLNGFPAMVAPFVYLSAVPVMQHGGSFRYDSIVAPLGVAPLLLILAPNRNMYRDCFAGALMGLSFFVTPKAVLFAPLFFAAILVRSCDHPGRQGIKVKTVAKDTGLMILAALATSGLLLGVHQLALVPSDAASALQFGLGATRKTVLDVPWFPRVNFLEAFVRWQPLPWLLIGVGVVLAFAKHRPAIALLSLGVLPIVFYRNAFPYYYVVMMAPTCILAAYAVHELVKAAKQAGALAASTLMLIICIGLLFQGLTHTGRLYADQQQVQRSIVSAVHHIFSEPVNYIDRCGMISSFRKVNFFMSTWGMENYRGRNRPFMPDAIRNARPAFVLVNSAVLDPQRRDTAGLLPEDRELIDRFYPSYWGPLRVAGAHATLSGSEAIHLLVPFPGRYRIVSSGPVAIDGVPQRSGGIIDVSADGLRIRAYGSADASIETSLTLFLAQAAEPPGRSMPDEPIFAGL